MRHLSRVLSIAAKGALIAALVFLFGGAASMSLSVVEGLRPQLYQQCPGNTDTVLGRSSVYSDVTCELQRRHAGLRGPDLRTSSIDLLIAENNGSVRTTVRVVLPKDDPLVRAVRSGDLTVAPYAIAESFLGVTMDRSSTMSWAGPTVEISDKSTVATVSVSNTESATDVATRVMIPDRVGTLDIRLQRAKIHAVRGIASVTRQGESVFHGRFTRDARQLTVDLIPAGSNSTIDDRRPPTSTWPALSRAWHDFLGPVLLPTIPWVVLLWCVRRRTEPWRRFRWLLRTLLTAHALLVGLAVLNYVDVALPSNDLTLYLSSDVLPRFGPPGGPFALYYAIPGATVLLLPILTFVAARSVRRNPVSDLTAAEEDVRRTRFAVTWTIVGLVLWLAALVGYGWMLGDQPPSLAGLVPLIAMLLLGAGAVLVAVVTRRRFGGLLGVVLLGVPLAVIAGLHDRSGAIPLVLRDAVPVLVGMIALLTLAHATVIGTGAGRIPRKAWWLLAILLAVLCVPRPVDEASWYALQTFAFRLDALIATVLTGALVVVLFRAGHTDTPAQRSSSTQRWLALGCAFIILTAVYSFSSRPSILLLISAAISAWWLIPRQQLARARSLERVPEPDRRQALTTLVRAGEARRVLGPLRKHVRENVSTRELTPAAAAAAVDPVERAANSGRSVVGGLAVQERAFGMLGQPNPAERLKWGALVGVLAGLPWTAITLYGVATTLPGDDPFPVLASLTAVVPLVLRWTAYGVLFAYFLPLLRGRTGLAKALCLFIAIAVPSIVEIIPAGHGDQGWQNVILIIVQTFSFAMTVGLLADWTVLRANGFAGSRIADVHNLGAVAAWASSIAISAGTALATALLVGLQPFLVGPAEPGPAPTPPDVTAGQTAGQPAN